MYTELNRLIVLCPVLKYGRLTYNLQRISYRGGGIMLKRFALFFFFTDHFEVATPESRSGELCGRSGSDCAGVQIQMFVLVVSFSFHNIVCFP